MEKECVDAWHRRWRAYRRELGYTAWDRAWGAWVSRRIGHLSWRQVTSDHIELIRDDLDAAILKWKEFGPARGHLLPRSALDVWHALTSAVTAARTSKRRDLRALEGRPNPCADVAPPGERRERSRSRQKPFIYPTEFIRLLESPRVPVEWRRVYAVACYTYLRPGELAVLRWCDIDMDHRIIHISRAWDYLNETPKDRTKTIAGVRRVPIEPPLVPLLRAMRGGHDDLVAPQMTDLHRVTLPILFRRHLRAAGLTRRQLHENSAYVMNAVFRTLRDTGITWLAIAGVPLQHIMRRAGHESPRTTMGYVKMAEDLTKEIGKPFPRLPRSLLSRRWR